jgi:hypothetical protein
LTGHDHPQPTDHGDHPAGNGSGDHPASGPHDTSPSGALHPHGSGSGHAAGWQEGDLKLNPNENVAADKALAHARAAEPRITDAMKALAHKTPGAKMVGLDYRLKGEGSFKRKLATDLLERPGDTIGDALARMKDTIRYTMELPDSSYTSEVNNILHELAVKGYQNITFKNTWDSSGYRGINSTWRDPVSGRIFELQFHTPDSFYAKMETHGLYERIRLPGVSPEEVARLEEEQKRIFGAVPIPDGAPGLRPQS